MDTTPTVKSSDEQKSNSVPAGAGPIDDGELLALVRHEATKFGRCCDLYQDGLGTFADHECQQRTFAMMRGVQQVLGVAKDGSPLDESEVTAARARARLNNAAPDLLAALKAAQEHVGLVRLQTGFDIRPIQQQVADAIRKAEA